MTIFSNFQFDPGAGEKHKQLSAYLVGLVEEGALRPGDQLPPVRQAAWSVGVQPGTMARAYRGLESRGLAYGHVGRGTFVGNEAGRHKGMPVGPRADAMIDLAINSFAIAPPEQEMAAGLARVSALVGAGGNRHGYEEGGGYPADRAAIVPWLRQWLPDVTPDDVVITGGGQSGLFLSLLSLVEPGTAVATEINAYPGLIAAAAQLGVPLSGVAMDAQGMLPDALDALCARRAVSLLVISSSIQNPTGVTLSPARRHEIVEIARRHDLTIVEDEVYGFLANVSQPIITNLAPERTVFLTSLSKIFAPELRIGYLSGPRTLLRRLTLGMKNSQLMVSPLLAALATEIATRGLLEQRRKLLQSAIAERFKLAQDILGPITLGTVPSGLIWLPIGDGWRLSEFCREAEMRGVAVVSGELFAANQGDVPQAVRISLTAEGDIKRLEAGLRVMADLVKEPQGAPLAIA